MKSVALLVLLASIAHASPATDDAGEPAYRSHIVLVDAAALGIVYPSHDTGLPTVGLGVLVSLLGAPAVHAAHGHEGRAAASLGLRCTLTLLAMFALLRSSGDEAPPLAIPYAFGMVSAAVVDAAWLGRGTPAGSRIAPLVTPARDAVTFGIAARF